MRTAREKQRIALCNVFQFLPNISLAASALLLVAAEYTQTHNYLHLSYVNHALHNSLI
jgi:hypothetical protein